ncbi:DEP domain-containing protein [Schizosaccharomyces japonicus yFS275]|uniref:Vacuolar membrane-associated protein IML1 n=1 Tax=Schizosaccharomyces japonicus (strain yFS275 / FY16936) TaxID=402676 RepID=B6JWP6_SCHJY|nr:DEP domain-containing protein [Schizosaccharomyces japonicus yFS275]EEB05797.1 DEP domain-containing protein [Schizosaccharomyces japonicus yFS275]
MSTTLTTWTHDATLTTSDAILNYDLVPSASLGQVIKVSAQHSDDRYSEMDGSIHHGKPRFKANTMSVYVMPEPLDGNLRKRQPNLQLSLSPQLANLLGISVRGMVTVSACENKEEAEAEYVVLFFRDKFISRSDMWRVSEKLKGTCVHSKQRVNFIGDVSAVVQYIWRDGQKRTSAYYSSKTKPIFRSESANFLIFIQMSSEMWHFEEDGELNFNKAIDGFLPDLFSAWKRLGAHHLVSIILFARVEYSRAGSVCVWENPDCKDPVSTNKAQTTLRDDQSAEKKSYKDFFKVVVDNSSSRDWLSTLANLKLELARFQHDVLVDKVVSDDGEVTEFICGRMASAQEGNFLEVINMAVYQFQTDYIDRDLGRTGTSIIIITPGTGLYEVDEKMLRLTSESLLNTVVGIDIVSLGKIPLYYTPVLRYKNSDRCDDQTENAQKFSKALSPSVLASHSISSSISNFSIGSFLNNLRLDTEWVYTLPIGCNISFYSTTEMHSLRSSWENYMLECQFQPTAKMHELQMIGVMETENAKISIPLLNADPHFKGDIFDEEFQDKYDERQFVMDSAILDLGISKKSHCHSIKSYGSKKPADIETLNSVYTAQSNARDYFRRELFEDSGIRKRVYERGNGDRQSILSEIIKSSKTRPATSNQRIRSSRTNLSTEQNFTVLERVTGFIVPPALPTTSVDPLRPPQITKPIAVKVSLKESGPSTMSKFQFNTTIKNSKNTKHQNYLTTSSGSNGKKTTVVGFSMKRPWKIIDNPFKPKEAGAENDPVSLRWEHLYIKARKLKEFNWVSMCTPGALPLTFGYFPSEEELEENFEEHTYTVSLDPEFTKMDQKSLLVEMVCQRLSRGYQIVVRKNELNTSDSGLLHERLQPKKSHKFDNEAQSYFGLDAAPVYLSLADSQFHRLCCDPDGYNIEVKRYVKRGAGYGKMKYEFNIWSPNTKSYAPSTITFSANDTAKYNWNYVDQLICGFETYLPDSVKYWRARFVLIPTNTFSSSLSQKFQFANVPDAFTEEEFRLEGINKLSELIYKAKVDPLEEDTKKTKSLTETNMLGINFTTLTASQFIASELESYKSEQDWCKGTLFLHGKRFKTTDSIQDIARELQATSGVRIKDLHWHYRVYKNCFIGSDLVTWLLNNFDDIDSREAALSFGNELLNKGLIEHVHNKHSVLDGHYFYRVSKEYSAKPVSAKPYQSWFSWRKSSEKKERAHSDDTSSIPRVELSKRILFNADPESSSRRTETITLHYDLLHNPASCYQIRIEWLMATASVIESLLQSWSRMLEKYGLKLVEAPIHEASAVVQLNPFDQVLIIELAVPPPQLPQQFYAPGENVDEQWWHTEILKYFNFVLDTEAANKFPENVNVTYSWGKPNYKYTQYIHRTGTILLQIDDEGRFLWLPNRLHNSKVQKMQTYDKTGSHRTSINTPSARQTTELLEKEFRAFCSNEDVLHEFYDNTLDHYQKEYGLMDMNSSISDFELEDD